MMRPGSLRERSQSPPRLLGSNKASVSPKTALTTNRNNSRGQGRMKIKGGAKVKQDAAKSAADRDRSRSQLRSKVKRIFSQPEWNSDYARSPRPLFDPRDRRLSSTSTAASRFQRSVDDKLRLLRKLEGIGQQVGPRPGGSAVEPRSDRDYVSKSMLKSGCKAGSKQSTTSASSTTSLSQYLPPGTRRRLAAAGDDDDANRHERSAQMLKRMMRKVLQTAGRKLDLERPVSKSSTSSGGGAVESQSSSRRTNILRDRDALIRSGKEMLAASRKLERKGQLSEEDRQYLCGSPVAAKYRSILSSSPEEENKKAAAENENVVDEDQDAAKRSKVTFAASRAGPSVQESHASELQRRRAAAARSRDSPEQATAPKRLLQRGPIPPDVLQHYRLATTPAGPGALQTAAATSNEDDACFLPAYVSTAPGVGGHVGGQEAGTLDTTGSSKRIITPDAVALALGERPEIVDADLADEARQRAEDGLRRIAVEKQLFAGAGGPSSTVAVNKVVPRLDEVRAQNFQIERLQEKNRNLQRMFERGVDSGTICGVTEAQRQLAAVQAQRILAAGRDDPGGTGGLAKGRSRTRTGSRSREASPKDNLLIHPPLRPGGPGPTGLLRSKIASTMRGASSSGASCRGRGTKLGPEKDDDELPERSLSHDLQKDHNLTQKGVPFDSCAPASRARPAASPAEQQSAKSRALFENKNKEVEAFLQQLREQKEQQEEREKCIKRKVIEENRLEMLERQLHRKYHLSGGVLDPKAASFRLATKELLREPVKSWEEVKKQTETKLQVGSDVDYRTLFPDLPDGYVLRDLRDPDMRAIDPSKKDSRPEDHDGEYDDEEFDSEEEVEKGNYEKGGGEEGPSAGVEGKHSSPKRRVKKAFVALRKLPEVADESYREIENYRYHFKRHMQIAREGPLSQVSQHSWQVWAALADDLARDLVHSVAEELDSGLSTEIDSLIHKETLAGAV